MTDVKFSQAQQEVLRKQVIDGDQPGTVLRDFQMLLDFVGADGLKAAGKYNLLPIDVIGELDARLAQPLGLKLKRPQLRSHPYLRGLHLLLRASGLSRVVGTGEKARLVVDQEVLERWKGLNPTEQYFTLLEAWLLVGRPEMVGEGRGREEGFLARCLQAWRVVPARGEKFDVDRPQDARFFGIWGDYHLALMDLFGLMKVDHPRSPVQPWCPAGVKHLPLGDAVFTLLAEWMFSGWEGEAAAEEDEEEEESAAEVDFGRWQPLFQPYFPEWRNNLVLAGAEFHEGVFVFKVSLGDIWRRIAIPADLTLDDLMSAILRSVRFDWDHLYEFSYRDRFGGMVRVNTPEGDEGPWADEVYIGQLPLSPGQSMNLVYDFGDDWRFVVKLERIDPPNARMKAPRIVEKHGKAPEQYPDWEE